MAAARIVSGTGFLSAMDQDEATQLQTATNAGKNLLTGFLIS
jgi:hypothetical protein